MFWLRLDLEFELVIVIKELAFLLVKLCLRDGTFI
jgi:hypothetical protein